MQVLAPISVGELIDKITILQIKLDLISEDRRPNVAKELAILQDTLKSLELPDISDLEQQLYAVNRQLWDIEDGKRRCEQEQRFGQDFIALARNVYIKNDLRASIKRQINLMTNSSIVEEKSYDK